MSQETSPIADYFVDAFNYATDSENRMHNDDTAPKYGFRGGLVPGVGVYGYMAPAMAAAFDPDWLTRGHADVRFLKPVYDGEPVRVTAHWKQDPGGPIEIVLTNADGVTCAVAAASLTESAVAPKPDSFSREDPPAYDARPGASLAALPAGANLGAFQEHLDEKIMQEFSAAMRAVFVTEHGPCHPAYYLALANDILVRNVALGPWIHAGSVVQHYATPGDGALLLVQGRVVESMNRKGHEMVVLDVLISSESNAIATVRHIAIIRPRIAA